MPQVSVIFQDLVNLMPHRLDDLQNTILSHALGTSKKHSKNAVTTQDILPENCDEMTDSSTNNNDSLWKCCDREHDLQIHMVCYYFGLEK